MSDFFRPQKIDPVSGPSGTADEFSMAQLLFGWAGRANRADYLVGHVVIAVVVFVGLWGLSFLKGAPILLQLVPTLILAAVVVGLMINLAAKRGRDLGLPVIVPVAVHLVPFALYFGVWVLSSTVAPGMAVAFELVRVLFILALFAIPGRELSSGARSP